MRLFLILIVLTSALVYWFHISLNPSDIASYTHLVQENVASRRRHLLAEAPASQTRQGVQKDIWTQDHTRHTIIQSQHSSLSLSQNGLIEELQNIRCIQNDFTLTSDIALYTYPTHQFTAQQNCHLLQNQNSIYATRVHFDFNQEIATCENPKGRLQDLNFTANELLWNKKENKLYLNGEVQLLSSHIQDKESFALADSLVYDLLDKTVHLASTHKVLFWQEGLSLSASEVLIHKDQTIQGLGDVHFSFNLEEQNIIDQFFKHYL